MTRFRNTLRSIDKLYIMRPNEIPMQSVTESFTATFVAAIAQLVRAWV